MNYFKYTGILVVALLTGCAATGDDYIKGVRAPTEMNLTLGTLTSAEADLIGPDANDNGVRDGIDLSIKSTFKDTAARSAATGYALVLSRAMLDGSRGRSPSDAQKYIYVASGACVDSFAGASSKALREQTAQGDKRTAALSAWMQRAGALPSAPANPCMP